MRSLCVRVRGVYAPRRRLLDSYRGCVQAHAAYIANLRREGKDKKDTEAAIDALNALAPTEDAGPMLDCVVWCGPSQSLVCAV